MSDLFQKYKLIIYLFFTVLIGESLVAIGIMSMSVVKTPMRKRCRSDLHSNKLNLYNSGELVNFEVLNSTNYFKTPFETNSCDGFLENKTCESGYIWSSPASFNENHVTMEYTLNLTACDTNTKFTKATSMFFIGFALGPYITGFIADRHGRKTALLIAGYSLAFVIFCSGYVQNSLQFGVANFV